jgi:hypothetical protein
MKGLIALAIAAAIGAILTAGPQLLMWSGWMDYG